MQLAQRTKAKIRNLGDEWILILTFHYNIYFMTKSRSFWSIRKFIDVMHQEIFDSAGVGTWKRYFTYVRVLSFGVLQRFFIQFFLTALGWFSSTPIVVDLTF